MASSSTGMSFSGSAANGDRKCKVYKGISINKPFVLRNSAQEPLDVSGWSASFIAYDRKTGGSSVLSITATIGTTDGLITLVKSAADMAALSKLTEGYFAYTATKSGGQKILLDSGIFEVDLEIPA